jgi:diphthamide synthase (EF-2-diphthine--ammonia ligase)
MAKPKLLLSWSTGKDSAYALHVLRAAGEYDVVGLLTTYNERFDRVAMHGIRSSVAAAQAAAIGLPVWRVNLPSPCSNEEYAARMGDVVRRAVADGITHMGFGDIHLADVRAYRETNLAGSGLTPVFPIWTGDASPAASRALAARMLDAGIRSVLTCVNPRQLDRAFCGTLFAPAGRVANVRRPAPAAAAASLDGGGGDGYDNGAGFLAALPPAVDACGENGEYHSLCFDGPIFTAAGGGGGLRVVVGETVIRDGFSFTDVVLDGSDEAAALDAGRSLVEEDGGGDNSATECPLPAASSTGSDKTADPCPLASAGGEKQSPPPQGHQQGGSDADRTGDACPLTGAPGPVDRTGDACPLKTSSSS